MATEKPAVSRTDMLTAYLKIEPLELTRLLAPAGLPPQGITAPRLHSREERIGPDNSELL